MSCEHKYKTIKEYPDTKDETVSYIDLVCEKCKHKKTRTIWTPTVAIEQQTEMTNTEISNIKVTFSMVVKAILLITKDKIKKLFKRIK